MNKAHGPGLRERKKAATRDAIQQQALRLFLLQGFESTTVDEIAAAANVSHMTFFRYFPTKEDVVMADEYDPLIAELIAARPAGESAVDKVQCALRASLQRIYADERELVLARTRLILSTPRLRARLWDQERATERLIVDALGAQAVPGSEDLHPRAVAAACVSAMTTAVLIWAEQDGARELPELMDEVFASVRRAFGQNDG